MAWDDDAEDLTTILGRLGYYDTRTLKEGDMLVGKQCCRNGCGSFEVGDRVMPMLVSTARKAANGSTMYVHRGLHVDHHNEAIKAVKAMV